MRARLSVLLILAVLFTATSALPSAATSGTWTITEDTTLTEDHNGRIIVGADNITIDCGGHTIQGPGSGSDSGVLVFGHDGVAVEDCDIREFHIGVHVEASEGTLVRNNALSDHPQNGILLIRGANNSTISNNTVVNAANEGITVVESSGNILDRNTVDETNKGIYLGDADGNTLTENTVTRGRSWFTIGLGEGSDNNTVTGNVVSITGIGILVDASQGNVIADNRASITDTGIGLFNGSTNNTVIGNNSSDNRHNGFFAEDAGNTFDDNAAHNNNEYGFEDASAGNAHSGNICVGNALGGSNPEGLCNPSGTFTDDDGDVFELDIEWMADAGVTKGCNPPANDLFCPDDAVNRGQMAAFLVRALGLTDDGGGNKFVDDDGSIFEDDIAKLAAAGITKGCNPPVNDMFCPTSNVTRGQMAAFLVRALGYTDDGGGDLFVDDNDSIFETDIDKLATAGVTRGCNPPLNDRFCPTSEVTRGQMAAFLHRALG